MGAVLADWLAPVDMEGGGGLGRELCGLPVLGSIAEKEWRRWVLLRRGSFTGFYPNGKIAEPAKKDLCMGICNRANLLRAHKRG